MKISVSKLVDITLSGRLPEAVKYEGAIYYPDETSKSYVNIYGVNLWAVLLEDVADGKMIKDMELEVMYGDKWFLKV